MTRVRFSFARPRTIRFRDTASANPRQARTPLHASRECVLIPENKDFCYFTGGFPTLIMGAELRTTMFEIASLY